MAIRTILAPLYDDAVDALILETSARLSAKFGAHVESLHMRVPENMTHGIINSRIDARHVRPLLEALSHQIERDEQQAKEAFERVMAAFNIAISDDPGVLPSASWHATTDDPVEKLSHYGGAFDLIVTGHPSLSSETAKSAKILDAAIFNSARPVLLMSKETSATVGDVVLLAWNRGIPAGRALFAALPFLTTAKRVVVLTVMTGAKQGPEPEDITSMLAWHGVTAEVRKVPPSAGAVADIITQEATDIGADLLVTGAYSQSRIRERVLGGVTSALMSKAQLPVLMSL